LPNCLITPHVANTEKTAPPFLAARIKENVARFVAGMPLVGTVDTAAGY
jgi:phosphoglycerate dehydrogenase-like enzyme